MERYHRWAWRVAALALLPLFAAACGGDSNTLTTPTQTTFPLTVQVRDDAQRAVAGALVRITDGENAGRNATSDQSGTATLSSLQPGTFSLEITAAGYLSARQAVTLGRAAQTATVQMKIAANTPPVITAIVAKGTYAGEPLNYVEAGETATVTVSVTDAETSPDKMTYEWKSDVGNFTGTGPSVQWRPPGNVGGSGPTSATLTVTVIEKYGPDNTLENRSTSNVRVVLHDGKKESGDLCTLFLNDFSNSNISAETAVRNFSGTMCAEGKSEEQMQIADNRVKYKITYSSIGQPAVTLNFKAGCGLLTGDACVSMSCEWRSTVLATGLSEHVKGTCNLTTVYDSERDAWKLCWSTFSGISLPSGRVIRSLRF